MMGAGRQLDALIARHIYGWDTAIYRDVFGHTLYIVDRSAVKTGEYSSHVRLIGGSWERGYDAQDNLVEFFGRICPAYSTSIEAAMQIVEKHPHYFYLVRSNDNGRFGWKEQMTWKCRFYAPKSMEAEADTAPLAICLAALKAVEETQRG